MANRLAAETSPYLRQHAENPVDWYPWGEEALALARMAERPILLSIGYSACHWCHVMARECFEDPEVAAEMNRHFVNVKVDREERPDLDQIYQLAHAMLTRRGGGWPLTVFLTPAGEPFFAGTYFPKRARHGLPGFLDLLPGIAAAWREKRPEIDRQNATLAAAFARTLPRAAGGAEPGRAPIETALAEFARAFDAVNGGIGHAPKFPHPAELAFCLRRHALDGDETGLDIARLTLTKMAEGGIRDHLGGGFYRSSVDEHWMIPHFEKMLCDNAALLALCADAWLLAGEPRFETAARETVRWLLAEMRSPEGAFHSALDADSGHEEGGYYVWTREEARAALEPSEFAVAAAHYGLDGPPNFETRAWHLRVAAPLDTVAHRLGLPLPECAARLGAARAKLLAARARRARPGLDDKVLTAWNALAVKGLARAARAFGEDAWLAAARRAADFLRTALWREGRLAATWQGGSPRLDAYLDDHAFLLDAVLELLQCEFRDADLRFARELAEALLARFEDAAGGFWFVPHDHERLIHRAKPAADAATPSGNGIAAFALQRLGHLLGEPRYLEAARRTLRLFRETLSEHASAHVSLLNALEEYLAPPAVVILRGEHATIAAWQRRLARVFRPATIVIGIPTRTPGLPAILDKPAPAGVSAVNAWVCRGVTCMPATQDPGELERMLVKR
ncbi:MAG: thioredoxin domain-containing protein [Burkholderiales bacterium]|nr:thioredoxin domain-containing protein [Burkholderiales bacterium]